MIDNGSLDEKIIAICADDPSLNCYEDISDLPPHILEEICHFFRVYKQLEGKDTFVSEIKDVNEAKRIIQESIDNYEKTFGK